MTNNTGKRRRHFTDEFKRSIVLKVQSGALNANNVVDENGDPIHPALVETWGYLMKGKGMLSQREEPIRQTPPPPLQSTYTPINGTQTFTLDLILSKLAKLQIENEQLKTYIDKKVRTEHHKYEGPDRRSKPSDKVM